MFLVKTRLPTTRLRNNGALLITPGMVARVLPATWITAALSRVFEDALNVLKDMTLFHLFGVAAASDFSPRMNDRVLKMEGKDGWFRHSFGCFPVPCRGWLVTIHKKLRSQLSKDRTADESQGRVYLAAKNIDGAPHSRCRPGDNSIECCAAHKNKSAPRQRRLRHRNPSHPAVKHDGHTISTIDLIASNASSGAGARSNALPPWLEITTPSTPISTARNTSSGCMKALDDQTPRPVTAKSLQITPSLRRWALLAKKPGDCMCRRAGRRIRHRQLCIIGMPPCRRYSNNQTGWVSASSRSGSGGRNGNPIPLRMSRSRLGRTGVSTVSTSAAQPASCARLT